MNPVEIADAVQDLVEHPFDRKEFPYAFLEAFGNKETTINRLRSGDTNKSDVGGVLQRKHIHMAVCPIGETSQTLAKLRESAATTRHRVRFVMAVDGEMLEAEDLFTGDTVACELADFPNKFGYFFPLAGITPAEPTRENTFDVKATSRLNKLYVALLESNPQLEVGECRQELNHLLARLIFCFFAEDTSIFGGENRFTTTVRQMSAPDSSNTHEVIGEIFRSMNTPHDERAKASIPRWATEFPFINGGLFSGSLEVVPFSRAARSHLLHIGGLDWTLVNPDIFGSMIQAVADDEERGRLGMHYTSMPNMLKVLNPLFLDELRTCLEEAGLSKRKLLNLRNRLAKIRVFDPACGSGNFLVTAYKELRVIEARINKLRGESHRRSDIRPTNFRGIEAKHFPAEVARLALIIAEFQCDVLHRGQQEALAEFLPLDNKNWITCGNALRLDWRGICPPTGSELPTATETLLDKPENESVIEFENVGGEVYVCGNPPFAGRHRRTPEQSDDLAIVYRGVLENHRRLDYVTAWYIKAARFCQQTGGKFAFVSTSSICQGEHVSIFWPVVFDFGMEIFFAHQPFKWSNLATANAGVACVIVGARNTSPDPKTIFDENHQYSVDTINPYLLPLDTVIVSKTNTAIHTLPRLQYGNMALDNKRLILSMSARRTLLEAHPELSRLIRPYFGAAEIIDGTRRWCLWIDDDQIDRALSVPEVAERISAVKDWRLSRADAGTNQLAARAHQFSTRNVAQHSTFVVPRVSSETREWLPCAIVPDPAIVSDACIQGLDVGLLPFSIVGSRLHLVWAHTVGGRLETRLRYSHTLIYNTFPVPPMTSKNQADLTECAENILLARESHYPATLAELYAPNDMPEDLRAAHERNDEVLERIYIGRRFKNDSERLETLFRLYAEAVN